MMVENAAVVASRGPTMPARRQMVERHLRRVLGPAVGRWEMGRLVDEAFASYARYWADSFRLPHLSRAEITAGIRYEGREYLRAAIAAGRGTILALPHLGGWEWGGTSLALEHPPVSVVVERLEPDDVFEWFVRYRQSLGMQDIANGPEAAARCAGALRDNHLLCLLSDRLVGSTSGVEVEFFGERTLLPAGPAILALRTGATVLPCAVYFGERSTDHLAVVRPPLEVRRSGGRLREDVQRITQALAREQELLIRRHPTQWHLLQPNWPSDPGWERKS
jgi:KDO2-lipid IV(A) lauroyltransferase